MVGEECIVESGGEMTPGAAFVEAGCDVIDRGGASALVLIEVAGGALDAGAGERSASEGIDMTTLAGDGRVASGEIEAGPSVGIWIEERAPRPSVVTAFAALAKGRGVHVQVAARAQWAQRGIDALSVTRGAAGSGVFAREWEGRSVVIEGDVAPGRRYVT
ncbi:MAG: hypothetical protein HYZ27_09755 [Deltaproteobacteria bacterium]|nr:hypothetical protein [Deltaproteobacteria bacterium]